MAAKGAGQGVATKKTVHCTFETVALFASKACRSTVVAKGRSCPQRFTSRTWPPLFSLTVTMIQASLTARKAILDLLLSSDWRFKDHSKDEMLSLAAGPHWQRRRDRMGREGACWVLTTCEEELVAAHAHRGRRRVVRPGQIQGAVC